uniref:Peripherin n=1 Tax=Anas platyrhynchos TaxID=8839 RepID=A0A8B9R3F5_ANAPL
MGGEQDAALGRAGLAQGAGADGPYVASQLLGCLASLCRAWGGCWAWWGAETPPPQHPAASRKAPPCCSRAREGGGGDGGGPRPVIQRCPCAWRLCRSQVTAPGGCSRAPPAPRRAPGVPPAPVSAAPGRLAEAAAARGAERAELAALNDRFAAFLERVRALERQNGALRSALGRAAAAAAPRAAGLVQGELRGLRDRLQRLGRDRDRLQAERDGLAAELRGLRQRLEDEMQKREDAEKSLVLFRKDVDDATLSRLELERKIELLMDEIGFLKKLHEEELRDLEVSAQSQQAEVQVELRQPDLTAALRDIRTQYESIAVKNLQEAEEWYKSKFADLSDAANRNHEALRLARQEMNESRRQIQSLTCEVDGLKGMNEALQRQMREMEDEFGVEIGSYQDVVGRLEQEIQHMKEEMARHLREYQDLLNIKMALDIEIATYRKLLEGEEMLELEPVPSPVRRMLLIKTIETRDGQVSSGGAAPPPGAGLTPPGAGLTPQMWG